MKLYEALGLEPALALHMEEVKKHFYERSRQWHPDKFSRASAAEQDLALEMTAVLNDAYRTLRDPVSRAEYFLKERGIELSKDAPAELLEEVFELNMALEELRDGDASVRAQLEQSAAKFRSMQMVSDTELASLFIHHDAAPGPAKLDQIRAALNRRRYVSNLVRDVEKELHVHSAN